MKYDVKLTIQFENITDAQVGYVEYAIDMALKHFYENEDVSELPFFVETVVSTQNI